MPVVTRHNKSYALPSSKTNAIVQGTLVIWCSLASRLSLWALKSELALQMFVHISAKNELGLLSTIRQRSQSAEIQLELTYLEPQKFSLHM
nr:GTP diphosphokinase RSH3 precursor [Tanacetum cinerariifolium]